MVRSAGWVALCTNMSQNVLVLLLEAVTVDGVRHVEAKVCRTL